MPLTRESHVLSVVMANGKQRSAWVAAAGMALFGYVTPATLDNTTVSFEVSVDGTESVDSAANTALAKADGSALSLTAAASTAYDAPTELAPWPFWRFVLGGTVAANRTFTVVAKG